VSGPTYRITEVLDERAPEATAALELIRASFTGRDRQSMDELRSELEEKRRGLLSAYDYHLVVALDEGDAVAGAVAGAYLEGVNAGFVLYLAVAEPHRGRGLGRRLRTELVRLLRENAQEEGHPDLSWVLGEVRSDSPWLDRLLRGGALTFDFDYYHPGMSPGDGTPRYTLYREPVADRRARLPRPLVRRILYSIYRRAYRVRYPLERPGFRAMLAEVSRPRARPKEPTVE
jgi:GNAT superfamily N-acetyltransferase